MQLLLRRRRAGVDRRRRAASSRSGARRRRPGWARSRRSPAARSACGCAPRPTAGWRVIEADDFRRLALRAAGRPPPRDAAGRAGDEPHHRASSRTASGSPRSARWPPGSRTSSTTRPPRPGARRRRWPRRSTSISSTLGALRRGRRRARAGRAARRAAAAGARPRRRVHGARRARRRRRRGRAARRASRSSASPSRGGSPSRSPSPASTRRGSTASPTLAGPATDAALRWVAASLTARAPRRRAARSRPSGCRASSARSSPTPTWTAASSSRSTCTRASRRRSPCSATSSSTPQIEVVRDYDRTLPKLTVRGSELNQVWTNLLDNAIDALGERGTITIATRARRRLRASSRSPTTARASPRTSRDAHLRPVLHDQGRRPGHRPRPRDRAADRRRPPRRLAHARLRARAARPSACGCPSRKPEREDAMPGCTHLDHVLDHRAARVRRRLRGLPAHAAARGCTCASAWSAATSAAATTRPTATRARTRAVERPSDHPLDRAGRRLVVVLRRRAGDADPGGARRDRASRPRRSAASSAGIAGRVPDRPSPAGLRGALSRMPPRRTGPPACARPRRPRRPAAAAPDGAAVARVKPGAPSRPTNAIASGASSPKKAKSSEPHERHSRRRCAGPACAEQLACPRDDLRIVLERRLARRSARRCRDSRARRRPRRRPPRPARAAPRGPAGGSARSDARARARAGITFSAPPPSSTPTLSDRRAERVDPPAGLRVQRDDDLRDREDRVAPVVRVGAVRRLALDDDLDRVARRVDGAGVERDRSPRQLRVDVRRETAAGRGARRARSRASCSAPDG